MGSFGSVYKGTLVDGVDVAIKVFKLPLEEALRSFEVESYMMRNIRHRNLVKIISGCSNDDFKALVLEFMSNQSLENWLYSPNHFLNLLQRLDIMIDVASALEYLHHSLPSPIVHCDLKPTNVLLDENVVAHVADFGISQLLGDDVSVRHTLTLATIGYMAPAAMAIKDLSIDQSALLAFKSFITFSRENILLYNWTTSATVCHWIGVSCSLRHGRVTALDLSDMGLTGTIPPHLGNLSFLVSLNLSTNNFHGPVPEELTQLWDLKFINLTDNHLNGGIPSSIGNLRNLRQFSLCNNSLSGTIPYYLLNLSKLEVLDLSLNLIRGNIPREIGQLPSSLDKCRELQLLALSLNRFTGRLPRSFGNLTKLQQVYLGYNNLQAGEIPVDIGNLQNLMYLNMAFNKLTGVIPSTIFNISTIRVIELEDNNLFGHLESSIGLSAPNLEELYLWGNNLNGVIPASISNLSQLVLLELGSNFFSGYIPDTLGNLRSLRILNLHHNNLTAQSSDSPWSFLYSLGNCRQLRVIELSYNPLSGTLPTSIGNLSSSVHHLNARNCRIKGGMPKEIGNLSSLIGLGLDNNELTGALPATIGRLQNLQALYLPQNILQGSIPPELCHLGSLYALILNGNAFHGSLPECLYNLSSLRDFDLSSNQLTSAIPSTLWRLTDMLQINLSLNSLTSNLPMDTENLEVLTKLDLSSNQFFGNLPESVGGLKGLLHLSLAKNGLQGNSPQSFGNLISLEFLDLSYNDLSGVIPKSLEKLSHLKQLNLSFNRLEGEIPTGGPFRNFSAQSFLHNYALCGSPQLLVPCCKRPAIDRSKRVMSLVLQFIFPGIAYIILIATVIFIIYRWRHKQQANKQNKQSFSLLATWRRVSYIELKRATNGFSERNLLGIGSFGSVYKGTLADGVNVAIKVFKLPLEKALRSFEVESHMMRNIRHRNLVKIISSCSNDDFKALVLEFMSNQSLENWLYSHNHFLNMLQRLDITIDVASALEYLHHNLPSPIAHCDLKPTNVLLDDNMVAHVADFGVSQLLGDDESVRHTLTLATIGYMAPVYQKIFVASLDPSAGIYTFK
ncbi:probable LRR receptor-like serine/threonine-protein kinase At3g47570 isoform X3 [Carica papaya]|uniref:probable LRR receptor-like serine/threonine-protein kinase At3g47570 isoform X3 n=1 Tax=Carica papaya TaxID=3649 RepID=UPI000B8C80FD|nr:probable LRR receptor-like serine/threonine-protein kinase At3g47570 isoform X3 [Carica papaya]